MPDAIASAYSGSAILTYLDVSNSTFRAEAGVPVDGVNEAHRDGERDEKLNAQLQIEWHEYRARSDVNDGQTRGDEPRSPECNTKH